MEKKLRVGLVGLGGICNVAHMPAYVQMEDVEICAVCDCNEEKIAAFREKWDLPTVPAFTDYKAMLTQAQLDSVDICTPNYLHSEIAVEALERGLHVFCEKPDAVSVSEAVRMQKAAETSGRHLMVMRNNRYVPA